MTSKRALKNCASVVFLGCCFFVLSGHTQVLAQQLEVNPSLVVSNETSSEIQENDPLLTPLDQMQSQTIALSYLQPEEAIEILNPVKSPLGSVIHQAGSNLIVIKDEPVRLREMLTILEKTDVQLFTMVFELTHATASELAKKIEGMVTPPAGKVKVDQQANKIIVTDTAASIQAISKIVDDLDERDRQILIKIKVVRVVLNDEHRLGVDWEAILSDYRVFDIFDNMASTRLMARLSLGMVASEDYEILLDALETVGSVEVLSSQEISTINNKEVRITQKTPLPLLMNFVDASGAASSSDSDQHATEAEMEFFVTPVVRANGFATLNVRSEVQPKIASQVNHQVIDDLNVEPSLNFSVLKLQKNFTGIIGGIIREEKVGMIKKVPILGDVPLLGMAFRSHRHNIKKSEIILFLTAEIDQGK